MVQYLFVTEAIRYLLYNNSLARRNTKNQSTYRTIYTPTAKRASGQTVARSTARLLYYEDYVGEFVCDELLMHLILSL